jgi:putative oxidoreductase
MRRLLPWLVRNPDRRADVVVDVFVLWMRVLMGWQLTQTGWGKLHSIDKVAAWFGGDLHIPFPVANAWAAASVEFVGGALLFVGLGSRIAAIPVAFTMCVAYATSDREALASFDEFTSAAPFPFLVMALLVAAYGPGRASLDAVLAKMFGEASA